jgi:hypothetical protein
VQALPGNLLQRNERDIGALLESSRPSKAVLGPELPSFLTARDVAANTLEHDFLSHRAHAALTNLSARLPVVSRAAGATIDWLSCDTS